MFSRKKKISLGLIALSFSLIACKTETVTGVIPGPTATPDPSATPITGTSTANTVASISAEVYLKIERQMEAPADSPRRTVGICKVPLGAAIGTTITCTPTVGGDFSIPEGDLYHSKLIFTSGTADASICHYLIFRPYYYWGSASAAFFPPFLNTIPTSSIDCRPGKGGAGCFNGPATVLVPGFPANGALIYLTNVAVESVAVLDSAFNQNQSSNRFTMNNKTSWASAYTDSKDFGLESYVGDTAAGAFYPPAGPSMPLGYTPSHQDYAVECRDQYYDLLYGVRVIMNDEDTVTGVNSSLDFYHTWP